MSENKNTSPTVPLTAADIKELLSTVIHEARKPIVTEEDLRHKASEKQMKLAELEAEKERIAAQEQQQRDCSHSHRDGQTRTVKVQLGHDFYRICQFCQKIIRPETERALFIHHEQHSMPAIF